MSVREDYLHDEFYRFPVLEVEGSIDFYINRNRGVPNPFNCRFPAFVVHAESTLIAAVSSASTARLVCDHIVPSSRSEQPILPSGMKWLSAIAFAEPVEYLLSEQTTRSDRFAVFNDDRVEIATVHLIRDVGRFTEVSVFVERDSRGNGIAKRLLRQVKHRLHSHGKGMLFITERQNAPAVALARSCGLLEVASGDLLFERVAP